MTGWVHAFDQIQRALGTDDTGPVEIWPEEAGRDAHVSMRYASGTILKLDMPEKKGPRMGGIFVGEEGKIEINRNKFTTNPRDFVKNPPAPKLAEKWEGDGWVAQGHIENWFDSIKSRAKPNADVEIGHRSTSMALLANISLATESTLHWDPQRERITNIPEANDLLHYEYRKPWTLEDA